MKKYGCCNGILKREIKEPARIPKNYARNHPMLLNSIPLSEWHIRCRRFL
jgi:hypothetical protein